MNKEKEESPKKTVKNTKAPSKSKPFFTDERIKFFFGLLITGFAVLLLLSCVAYLFWWKTDQSIPNSDIVSGPDVQVKNWGGKGGHFLAKMIIGYGFGYGAFFIPMIFGAIGLYLLNFPKIRPWNLVAKFTFATIILSLLLGFIFGEAGGYLMSGPGGAQGYTITRWLNAFMGKPGTGILLTLITISYLVFALKVHPSKFNIKIPAIPWSFKPGKESESTEIPAGEDIVTTVLHDGKIEGEDETSPGDVEFLIKNRPQTTDHLIEDVDHSSDHGVITETAAVASTGSLIRDLDNETKTITEPEKDKVEMDITKPEVNDILSEEEVNKIMENYDPRLDLSRYKFPPVSILKEHKSESSFDNNEVFENKENIIKTLSEYKVSIRQISATVGPTVTLYEIVPERGVRLARIKSLEDDIALSLSALGIRIIAPIPGRGTVGIEVPNKKPEIVSMRSLITSKAFPGDKIRYSTSPRAHYNK
jgi:hypothetical protein